MQNALHPLHGGLVPAPRGGYGGAGQQGIARFRVATLNQNLADLETLD